ncbi:MAG: zinc ABC transporter substrate-binding protein [Terricaulis sp.]
MKKLIFAAVATFAAAIAFSAPASALNVFACEPEWGALSTEIGGDKVHVYVATTGGQDPHQVQARPSLIASARTANVTVCTGAELEVGWLPQIIQQSSNGRIAPGTPGAFEATSFVHLLETPASVDRSQGDIHAGGNPHIQTDPRNMIPVSRALAQRFAALDPANAAVYQQRQANFEQRWNAALARWTQRAAPLRGASIAVQHHAWIYLEVWLGLREIIPLEPHPGVPPSSGYLAQVLARLQQTPARFVIRAAYEDNRPADFISQRAHIPAVVLPFTVGGDAQATDLFSLYDDTITKLLAGIGQ